MIRKVNMALLLICVIVMLSYIITSTTIYRDVNQIWVCVVIGLFILIYWVILQQNSVMRGRWAKPSNLLFLANFIVAFQWLIEDALGYNPGGSFITIPKQTYTLSSYLGLVSVISITIGYGYGIDKNTRAVPHIKKNELNKSLFFLLFVYYVSFGLFIININVMDFLLGAAYADSNDVTTYGYFEMLYNCVTVAIIVQILRINKGHKKRSFMSFIKLFPILFWIPLILYVILRGLSGDRGPIICQFLILFFSYIYYSKKVYKLSSMILAVLIVGSSISIIGIARSMSTTMAVGEKYSKALSEFNNNGRFGGKSIFPPTQELSISFVCTNEGVREIELQGQEYNYGLYQIVHVIETIPFIPSFLRQTLNLDDHRINTASRIADGAIGRNRSWSTGTCMIADFFLDLGIVGVFLGCILVGYIFCWVDKTIVLQNSNNIYGLGIALYLSSKALYIPRTAFLGEFRPIFFICLFLFINKIIFFKK